MTVHIPELSLRSREVLRQIVDSYVESGEPVGSRTLARGMSLSPATIRNVMADLQDAGLLFSPHTSAGRLPTEAGLRLFVDGILEAGRLSDEDRRSIDSRCVATGRSPQQALEDATRMLSGLGNVAANPRLTSQKSFERPNTCVIFFESLRSRPVSVFLNNQNSLRLRLSFFK